MSNFTKAVWGAALALALMWPAQTTASPRGSGQLETFPQDPSASCASALGARVADFR